MSKIAAHAGMDTEQLLLDAAVRLVEEAAQFRAAVREGIAAADRGDFVEDDAACCDGLRVESALEFAFAGTQPAVEDLERISAYVELRESGDGESDLSGSLRRGAVCQSIS